MVLSEAYLPSFPAADLFHLHTISSSTVEFANLYTRFIRMYLNVLPLVIAGDIMQCLPSLVNPNPDCFERVTRDLERHDKL